MHALALDTNAAVKRLEQGGLTRAQADAITEVVQSIDASPLTTKHDLDTAIHDLKIDLIKWMIGTHLAYAAIIVGILGTLLTIIL